MAALDLAAALAMTDEDWQAAEAEREEQAMLADFLAKWIPVWRYFGVAMPGYEAYLIEG